MDVRIRDGTIFRNKPRQLFSYIEAIPPNLTKFGWDFGQY